MLLSKKRITKAWIRLRGSDCAVAQAGLRLCCSQIQKDRVSRAETQVIRGLYKCFNIFEVNEMHVKGMRLYTISNMYVTNSPKQTKHIFINIRLTMETVL